MADSPTIDRIVSFLEAHREGPLPESVVHEGKRSLLNILGASAGAMETEPIRILRTWAAALGGPGEHPVLWTADRLNRDTAALVNAAGMHVLDFDDTHIPTHAHASAPTTAAALAVAADDEPGDMLLRSIILGMEVHYAFAKAVMPSHFRRGFHVTATGGAVGAASACSVLLRLTPEQTAHALSTAIISVAGLREGLTTMSNSYGVGNSARTGLVASQLARLGFRSAITAFDGPVDGFRKAMSDADPDTAAAAFDALGTIWTIAENSYKRYPTETITQATVEGVLRLRASVDEASARNATSIDVVTAPLVAEVVGTRSLRDVPTEVIARTFDTRFCAAMAWLTGEFSPRSMQPDASMESEALALRSHITVSARDGLAVEQAEVTVNLADGRRLTTFVDGYRGSAATPMLDSDLEAKLRQASVLSSSEIDRVIDTVWNIERRTKRELIRTITAPSA